MEHVMRNLFKLFLLSIALLLTSCSENQSIVNNVEEKEANEIIVFLASKGIEAQKMKSSTTQVGGGVSNLWNITVNPNKAVDAMAYLNQQGLPKIKGTTLLNLFAKQGLMSTDREETIRYQAGIEEELKNVITKIDGILDANVQISFPTGELTPGAPPPKAKAAVYIKHQGVLDDPNNHLEIKIKKLLAGSVENLSYEDVSIISDKSKITDIGFATPEEIAKKGAAKEYVSIWSIIMTKSSASKFRAIFFIFIGVIVLFGALSSWLVWKFYPMMKKK